MSNSHFLSQDFPNINTFRYFLTIPWLMSQRGLFLPKPLFPPSHTPLLPHRHQLKSRSFFYGISSLLSAHDSPPEPSLDTPSLPWIFRPVRALYNLIGFVFRCDNPPVINLKLFLKNIYLSFHASFKKNSINFIQLSEDKHCHLSYFACVYV